MTIERPMFPPRAESVDSFYPQPAIGQPESGKLASESPSPIEGLSRRVALAGFVAAAALPMATAAPVAQALDAELIELGARFEPLVDQYYAAHRRWSRVLAQAHAEQEAEFGLPAERDYQDTPEIIAAWRERCDRLGVHEADDRLSAIGIEREPIQFAINALPVSTIEGLRVKALVAFFDVQPSCCGDTEYHFQDEVAFQHLFTAVAELCGLKDKMAATGYGLPEIGMLVDDDSDDDGEEA